jgi:hypothetical protein
MDFTLDRIAQTDQQTLGLLAIERGGTKLYHRRFRTLELPWRDNENRISCIPEGTYPAAVRYSQRYGRHIHVQDVPGRTLILLHAGNFISDTAGCVLAGVQFADINRDGLLDVVQSGPAVARIMELVPDGEQLTFTVRRKVIGRDVDLAALPADVPAPGDAQWPQVEHAPAAKLAA